jgi:cytochrome c oxidase subunit III
MSVARINMPNTEKTQYGVNPKKFVLWAFLITVTMLFAAFTSGLIVRRAQGNWMFFNVPNIFNYNTIIILLSSVSMQWAYNAAKKDEIHASRRGLIITFLLGCLFVAGQVLGYKDMVKADVFLTGNPSGSFFYVITFMHALHLIGGIIALIITLIASYRFRVHSRSLLGINLCTTYWHFIGGLWLYLFAILTLVR